MCSVCGFVPPTGFAHSPPGIFCRNSSLVRKGFVCCHSGQCFGNGDGIFRSGIYRYIIHSRRVHKRGNVFQSTAVEIRPSVAMDKLHLHTLLLHGIDCPDVGHRHEKVLQFSVEHGGLYCGCRIDDRLCIVYFAWQWSIDY